MRDRRKPSFWGSLFFCWHDTAEDASVQSAALVRPCVAIVHQRPSAHQQPQHLKPLTMPTKRRIEPPKGQFTPPEKRKTTPFSAPRPSMSVRERAMVYEHQQQQQNALLRSASSITDMMGSSIPSFSCQPVQQRKVCAARRRWQKTIIIIATAPC